MNPMTADKTYLVVENSVLLFHTGHESVLGERFMSTAVLLIGSFNLILQTLYIGWKKSMKFEGFPLFVGKCRTLIEIRRPEKSRSLELLVGF
jgi:hypothetical protein